MPDGTSHGVLKQAGHLLSPKWLTLRARIRNRERGKGARTTVLVLLGVAFWSAIFALLYRLLVYFKGVPEIGPLLAGKVLGTLLIGFFSILLLSNIVSALSSFFLARDLDHVVGAPIDWLAVYLAKLTETVVSSSWMVGLMVIPMLAAYGVVFEGGPFYPLIALAVMLPFFLLPAVLGSAATLLLVNLFPARRTRDILSVIAVMAAAGVVLLFRLMRPEQLARPEGFRSLVDFVGLLRAPTSPWLPSDWVQHALMSWLDHAVDPLPFYLLWTTAGAFVALGASLHYALYAKGFTKAQESGRQVAQAGLTARILRFSLGWTTVRRRELVLKELRVFFRDTTQWSQLILLGVLIVVYVFNVKFLPLDDTSMVGLLLRNLLPFANILLAGFVLAAIAARFIFPGISLEGRTFWLLRASPLDVGDLLWAKYWVGTVPLLVLAIGIVAVTDALLKVDLFIFSVSVGTIILLTFAMAAMAVCFGTLFPQFESENAAQIPTSFGGLVYMMTAVLVLGAVVFFEARPVYDYVHHRMSQLIASPAMPRRPFNVTDAVIGFGLAGTVCLTAIVLPIRVAFKKLQLIERAS